MLNSCVVLSFMDTLLVFVTYWKYFPTFTTVVIRACFSKRSKRLGFITFFCNSVMDLAAGDHSSILVVGSS